MNKNIVLENNLVCTTAVVDYINNLYHRKVYLKCMEYELMVRAHVNGGKITEDDIREVFGFGRS